MVHLEKSKERTAGLQHSGPVPEEDMKDELLWAGTAPSRCRRGPERMLALGLNPKSSPLRSRWMCEMRQEILPVVSISPMRQTLKVATLGP